MLQHRTPIILLLLGIVCVTGAHMVISIDLLGWLAYVPFLVYLSITRGIMSRVWFVLALIAGWSVCMLKITTPPIPLPFLFLFSIPISLFHLPGFLLWDRFKSKPGALFLFPAVMTIMEWVQYTFTPFASWGVAAYTQSHTFSMMQTLSLAGMPGLSFLVYWIQMAIADLMVNRNLSRWNFYTPLVLVFTLLIYGGLRYELSKFKGHETIKVAAIGTDSDVAGFPLPSDEVNSKVKASLFARTELAANSDAKLVVWNEAATFILPDEDAEWSKSLSILADSLNIHLFAAYIVPLSEKPMKYENKYRFYDPQGKLLHTYFKHQPVPSEPAIKGTEPLEVFDLSGITTGGVICYDYDFPYLAKGYGQLDADLVADPSSDWRGIDPIHTRMAAYRAVEQGHSILRSTRFGLSAAITPYGEFTAQMSSFDSGDKVMIAHLPTQRVKTIYSLIGDIVIYFSAGLILWFFIQRMRK